MKLHAKVFPKYFEEIKAGRKLVEYRQLESIIFINSVTGEEMEFEIDDIVPMMPTFCLDVLRRKYPDVPWREGLTTVQIRLGRRIL